MQDLELEDKKVKIDGEHVKVYVRFRKTDGRNKRRFYTHDALNLIKQKYPTLKVGNAVKVSTAKNYGDSLEGEWIFEMVKETLEKKRTASALRKEKSKTEVVSEQTD